MFVVGCITTFVVVLYFYNYASQDQFKCLYKMIKVFALGLISITLIDSPFITKFSVALSELDYPTWEFVNVGFKIGAPILWLMIELANIYRNDYRKSKNE